MKIFIIDDHQLFITGIKHLIQSLDDNIEFMQAGNATDALKQVEQHNDIDLILLDLSLPGMSGLSFIDSMQARNIFIPTVILSASNNPQDIKAALDAGALAYIHKSCEQSELLLTIEKALQGQTHIPEEWQYLLQDNSESTTDPLTGIKTSPVDITSRQMEVLSLMSEGLSNKCIARQLGVAENTVKVHVRKLLEIMKSANRTECVKKAQQLGVIHLGK